MHYSNSILISGKGVNTSSSVFIIAAYQNNNLPNENKFLMVENTINNNFAGTGIAKFVAGKSWNGASKEVKKEYIKLFKRHLALNISSMMQGYSDQEYQLTNSSYDEKNKVTLVDMEIFSDTGSCLLYTSPSPRD